MGRLLDINGGTGLLARFVAPENSWLGQLAVSGGLVLGRQNFDGEAWVGVQGGNGISRDQYAGTFFGYATLYKIIQDQPDIKKECAKRAKQMLTYLIQNNWKVDEDRSSMANSDTFPTVWSSIAYQKITFLVIGETMWPGLFTKELEGSSPLSGSAWVSSWLGTLDHINGYYGNNLNYIVYYNYALYEKDGERKNKLLKSFSIKDNYLQYSINPHFDVIRAAIHPELRTLYAPVIQESLQKFSHRNHRTVAPLDLDLSTIEWIDIGKVHRPRYPLDITLRRYTGQFQWERSPFAAVDEPGEGSPEVEKPGIDYTLPYWMARYYNIL